MEKGLEIWKSIKGYEGIYEISNWGRVKSTRRFTRVGRLSVLTKEIILIPQKHSQGYLSVGLHLEKVQRTVLIHRLVAEYFIENKLSLNWVNHIDGDKTNNYYKNLEWCTPSENNKHAFRIGLMVNKKRGESNFAKKAIHKETGIIYNCIKDAFDAYGKFNYGYFIAMLKGVRPNKTGFAYYKESET